MEKEIVHVNAAPNGAILQFPFSACYFMKVCDPYTMLGGVVELLYGSYFTYPELEKRGLGNYCKVVYPNLDALYFDGKDD